MRIKKFNESQNGVSYRGISSYDVVDYFAKNEFAFFNVEEVKEIKKMFSEKLRKFVYITIHGPHHRHVNCESLEDANCLFIKFDDEYDYFIYKITDDYYVLNKRFVKPPLIAEDNFFMCDELEGLKKCWKENFVPFI